VKPGSGAWVQTFAALALAACASARPEFPAPVEPSTPTPDASFRWRTAAVHPLPMPALNANWFKLDNGFTVVHLERDDLPIVSLRYVNRLAGSADSAFSGELIALTGDALVHGGTRFADGKVLSRVRVNGVLPSVATSRDSTTIGIDVLAPAFGHATIVLARTVQSPAFDPGGIEVARGLTLDLLRDRFDGFEAVVMDQVMSDLIGREAARDLSGSTPSVVKAVTRAQIVRCHAELYRPDASALVVVGAARRAEVIELAQRWFGSWQPAHPEAAAKPKLIAPRASAPGVRIHLIPSLEQSQAGVLVAKLGAPLFSEHFAALEIAGVVLGAAANSRLNLALREEQAKTYFVRAAHEMDRKLGMFAIRGAFDATETAGVVSELTQELTRLTREPVPPAELDAARARVRATITDRLATNSSAADLLAGLFEVEAPDALERIDRELARVDASLLREAARRYLDPSSLDVFVFGPPRYMVGELSVLGNVRLYRVVERY
jgi:zinc protease